MPRALEPLRSHRFLLLLLVQLAMVVTQPFAHRFVGGRAIHEALMTLVLFAVVLVVFSRHSERLAALALAVPAMATRWLPHLLHGEAAVSMSVAHHAAIVIFLSFAVFAILRGIFEEDSVLTDHILGTICGYLLAGVAWGNAYTAIDLATADSFHITPEIAANIATAHDRAVYFNYFSLSTLTSAGFGDISPTGSLATTLTWMEAAFGQFYIAVVVAQLVGLRLAQDLVRRA